MRIPLLKTRTKILVLVVAWGAWFVSFGVWQFAFAQDFSDIGVGQGITNEPVSTANPNPVYTAPGEDNVNQLPVNTNTGAGSGGGDGSMDADGMWYTQGTETYGPPAPGADGTVPPSVNTGGTQTVPPGVNTGGAQGTPPGVNTGGTSRGQQITIQSPLRSAINSIPGLVQTLLQVFVVLAVPVIVFFIILAGFNYVTAKGDATKVKDATRALTYAVIGGLLVIGAASIAAILGNMVNSILR